ncbi:cob(I)yrinic acid a,c-diamide adenosyltransferase [Alicyclobacillus macrosporangiidus]|uniref:Corrinoid adenosyltransferase n=1 Tax=Alicyclobacillus macrosporangiidus TaxID=392015 RepID=A0A1I7JK91_9BACL|nr:cob(I)yrinic acid a,c-diamide adenosyltransferase [Alicyclobacillus macrosporangiidus]SFU85596.1 cob(I)alamin adenosyltransferase [Alicyclobacillus macrosporangiidus]
MRIYTRGGDQGKTGLIGGVRRFKDDVRVEAYGAVDEAGAFIGLAIAHLEQAGHADVAALLTEVQQTLWDVGADLAAARPDRHAFRTPEDAAARLEPWIDQYKDEAEAVRRFVLRGGSVASAYLHVACTVVRRAERRAVRLMQAEAVHLPALRFLNRLSDLLFVLARAVNARDGRQDVEYRNSREVFRP